MAGSLKRLAMGLGFFLLLLTLPLQAAGTATWSDPVTLIGGVNLYTVTWTSNASGSVTGNSHAVFTGRVLQVKAIPNAGGTQPSDSYDLTIVDADGVDILTGEGVDQSNAAGEYLLGDPSPILDGGTLDVRIANGGNAKGGTVKIWIQEPR